jgi:heme-degrading monooxygenase HmoA
MTFQEDKIEAFLNNFHQTKHLIRGFEGCLHLELLQDAENPCIFCTYSHWASEEYLNLYRDSALFKEVWSFTKALFADKPTAFSVFRLEIV